MKRLVIIFIVIFLLLPIYSYASGVSYKSATEYDYPPFSVTDKGVADGFSVDLLKAVAKVMGLDITFKIDDWATLKEELKTGDIDVLPLVGYTVERDRNYDFTVPYIIMHGNIFIRTDEKEISTIEDLSGKEIIVMDGDIAHEYALRMGFSDTLILAKTYQEAFKLLSSGKYDAILAQSLVGEQLIKQLNIKNIKAATRIDEDSLTLIRTELSGFEQKFCFAVKEGDKELLAKLNEGLSIVSASGEFDRFYKKWFPFFINNKPAPIEVFKTSLIILAPILLLVIFVGIIYTKRNIKQRTKELNKSNEAILDMEANLRSQQKLESIGVLASGVAHEINNPINGILNYGQLIYDMTNSKETDCNEYRDSVLKYSSEIINESNRISSIVSNLLQISRNGSKHFKQCDIGELINRIMSLVSTIISRDQIEIEIQIDKNLPEIECREQELQQVALNLIINAKDALNSKFEGYNKDKKIIITAVETLLSDNVQGVRITIADNGIGISTDIQSKIFDPFFTTKSRSEGTGLGLSISYGIIKEHHGELSFETYEGEFAKFHIDLPIKQPDSRL